jgi:hypothetical protein
LAVGVLVPNLNAVTQSQVAFEPGHICTVVHEKTYHDAGSDSLQELTVAQSRLLIEEAGRVPVERDTLYYEVVRKEGEWRTGRALRLVV